MDIADLEEEYNNFYDAYQQACDIKDGRNNENISDLIGELKKMINSMENDPLSTLVGETKYQQVTGLRGEKSLSSNLSK